MSAGGSSPAVTPPESPARAALARTLLRNALEGAHPAQIINAPRGMGKTTLLRRLGAALWPEGRLAVLLEFDRLCTCPADFPSHLIDQLRRQLGLNAGWPGPSSGSLMQRLHEQTAAAKPDLARVLELSITLPEALAADLQRDIVLLIDDLAEIARFFRHAALRGSLDGVAARVAGRPGVRLIATISPAARPAPLLAAMHAATAGRLQVITLEPLAPEETADLFARAGAAQPDAWHRATAGRPHYIEILTPAARAHDPARALRDAMRAPHGTMHQECRYDYHLLIERSRGDAAVRGILDLLALQEGANVTAIARHLKIALPTALDYLSWLLEVGLIQKAGSGYVYADPLLKLWVRLNGPRPVDARQEVEQFLARPLSPPAPPARRRGRRARHTEEPAWDAAQPAPIPEPPATAEQESRDALIEID